MELRPYQVDANNALLNYFLNGGTGNPLVVAPTGSGKSVLIGSFARTVCQAWQNQRILVLAHRKELIEQNAHKLLRVWPDAHLGIYSAGMRKRQLGRQVTIAGIQSIYNKAPHIDWVSLVLIDECHLVPARDGGMYTQFLTDLRRTNSRLRVIGYSATPYRLDSGTLLDGDNRIFTDVAYEISINRLIEEGYLAPLVSKSPTVQADLHNVGTRGGEYIPGQAQAAMNVASLTEAAIDEMQRCASNRRRWLVFCTGVEHADDVCAAMIARGISARCVTGETVAMLRDTWIADFRAGRLQALVNCEVLTTGFDAPEIDMIALLRPTKSVGLYVQMVGRGMRVAPGKENCMVLDFAGNIEAHGPIDQIRIRHRTRRGRDELEITTQPTKICPQCHEPVPLGAFECPCGFQFPPAEIDHDREATDLPIMVGADIPDTELLTVERVSYFRNHRSQYKAPTMRVSYQCSTRVVDEWVCFEHEGWARAKAERWWRTRGGSDPCPVTVDEALGRTHELRDAISIAVVDDGKYDRITTFTLAPRAAAEPPPNRSWDAFAQPDDDIMF